MKEAGTMEQSSQTVDVRLISLDFDGTILVYDDPAGVFHPDVIRFLNQLPFRGVQWCANSGRDFADQLGVLERSRQRGLTCMPEALICSESLVYVREGGEYHPLQPWNDEAHRWLAACHAVAQERIKPHLDDLQRRYEPISTLIGELYTAFFVRDHDGLPVSLFHEINRMLEGVEGVMLTRNGGWVAVMHAALGKGNALSAYARHVGLERNHILAVGDQYNDLPMLHRDVARHVGCPGDAIPEVRQAVRKAGGHVAEAVGPLGTLEVMSALLARA